MSEHLLTDDINKYMNRALNASELLKADEHLAQCDLCFARLSELRGNKSVPKMDVLQFSPAEPEHLSYERLEAYVDEKSDDVEREIADVHLQACHDCSLQLEGLLQMRKLVEADSERQVVPPQPKTTSIFDGIRAFLQANYSLKYSFAALALLLFVSFVAFFVVARRNATDETAVVSSPSVNLPPNIQNLNADANSGIQTDFNVSSNTKPETNINVTNRQTETQPENLPPAYREEIANVLNKQQLNLPPELKTLNNQIGKLMGGATEGIPFAVTNPVGKILQSKRPQFRWRELSGAESYIVKVYDTDFNEVATSPKLAVAVWQIDKPLARGKTYLWQVTAIKNGEEIKSPTRPAPDARFKILDAKKADELARLNRQYKNEHLFLGIMYANAGLVDEATREFQREIAKNPNSKQARKFLHDVRAAGK